MSILSWWRELRDAQKQADALKVVEEQKIKELHDAIEKGECQDLDAATLCIESISLNLKGTGKVKKKE